MVWHMTFNHAYGGSIPPGPTIYTNKSGRSSVSKYEYSTSLLRTTPHFALVMELVDMRVLEARAERRTRSSRVGGTIKKLQGTWAAREIGEQYGD